MTGMVRPVSSGQMESVLREQANAVLLSKLNASARKLRCFVQLCNFYIVYDLSVSVCYISDVRNSLSTWTERLDVAQKLFLC